MRVFRVRPRTVVVLSLVLGALLILSCMNRVPLSFVAVMVLWTCLFLYTVLAKNRQIAPACFLIAFFVFLIGRQFCYHYLHVEQVYEYLDVTNNTTYLALCICMIGLCAGIILGRKGKIRVFSPGHKSFLDKDSYGRNYQVACLLFFLIAFSCSVIAASLQAVFVQRVGYLESYTEDAGGAGIPRIVSAFAKTTPLMLGLLLATRPKRNTAKLILVMYEAYGVLTLFTGQRYPFVGVSIYVFIYCVIRGRTEEGWLKKKHIIAAAVGVPLLVIFLNAYDTVRLGKEFSMRGVGNSFQEFLVQQGGSVNTIRRTIYNAEDLQDMKFVSFSGVYSVVFENPIGRRIFNITTYTGNSIERAFHTHSLAHRLSYLAYGDLYLQGRGAGTSFVAELLHDFGMLGVFLGSLLYGVILSRIAGVSFSNKLHDGLRLAMIYYLLMAPRGEFDSFISGVINIYTIVGFCAVLLLAWAFRVTRRAGATLLETERITE